MANYKRGYARTKTRGRKRWRDHRRPVRGDFDPNYAAKWLWLCNWPRWHDIEYHRRPKRRAERELIVRVLRGDDPDDLAWPLGNHKPHRYYW